MQQSGCVQNSVCMRFLLLRTQCEPHGQRGVRVVRAPLQSGCAVADMCGAATLLCKRIKWPDCLTTKRLAAPEQEGTL